MKVTFEATYRRTVRSLYAPFSSKGGIQIQNIITTNILTKFHEDWTINVTLRVLTGGHVFQPTGTNFELVQDLIGTTNQTINVACRVLTRLKKNVASRVLTRNKSYIIRMNLLTEFHEDRTINVASRVLKRFYKSHTKPYKENAPPPDTHLLTKFYDDQTINVASRFHEDRTINVASRVLTSHIQKNAPPPGGHVLKATGIIFELFHDDRKINVASRVLTRKIASPSGGHVFQPTGIIFELVQDIIRMNLLTKFHVDWTINVASRVKNATPPGSHTNLQTKFHDDWKINVASRENCPAPGDHVFQPTDIIFKLVQDIIGMNLLTNVLTRKNAPPPGSNFHDDWKLNVASRVKNAPPPGGHVF
ncbi:hypothetical protein DPMN_138101 [Dreissena polymorpha]|uniref:Uncharacterized protein n=1 Tax=Dreissena polymorpha TaxID=45954 RepID=A0A9D4G358_DREPO|nr:hypothetical protein DPMN_138101 [Dreissena polymorpha]